MKFMFYVCSILAQNYAFSMNFSFEVPMTKTTNQNCILKCEVPYGKEIGVSNNVKAYSNCNSGCINRPGFEFKKESTGLIKDIWIGLPWQCVEYVRRWVLQNQNIEFDDVDFAYEIWNRKKALNLKSGKYYKYVDFENGNESFPKEGDLLIYDKTELFPYGHVAVITKSNISDKFIEVAEENYQNKIWEDVNSYSRKIKLLLKDNKFYVTDISYINNKKYSSDSKIIGWKRLIIEE
jgi:hypothetical protein